MSGYSWRPLWGDLCGGVTAGIGGLPIDVNYGLLALAPLGAAYGAFGIVAALHASILAGVVAALAGSRPGLISGARPGLMLIIASLVAALLADPRFISNGRPDIESIFAAILLCVLLVGVLQIGLGVLRLGHVIAFVPQPVRAGLSAGIALTMLVFALKTSFGVPVGMDAMNWLAHEKELHPLSGVVTGVTFWVMLRPLRAARNVPPVVVALICGMATHFALAALFGDARLSGMVASIESGMPQFAVARAVNALRSEQILGMWMALLPYALAIAALASIESLLAAATADMMTRGRHDSDRELVAQGAGNLAAACFGGTPTAVSVARTTANINAGGTTRAAGIFYSLFVLAVVIQTPQWLAYLPRAVVGGILIHFAWIMIDEWQRSLLRQALSLPGMPHVQRREVLANAWIVALVAALAVAGNLMQAVALGVAAALFLFVGSQARHVVRGIYSGRDRHSLKVRNAAEAAHLEHAAERIGIVEADGTLFFGSAERLARELDKVAECADVIVLDLRHVTDADSTASRILHFAARRVQASGRRLLLAHVTSGSRIAEVFAANDLQSALPRTDWYPDLDAALEVAEDAVLAAAGCAPMVVSALSLEQTDIVSGLDAEGISLVKSALAERRFGSGEAVFRSGDPGNSLYVLTRGSIEIWMPMPGDRRRRIAAFGPGVAFGEMALIDGQPRSADAIADGEAEALEPSRGAFEKLMAERADIGRQLLLNLSQGLSQRLRSATLDLRAAVER